MSDDSEIYNDASDTCSVSERSEAEENLAELSKCVSLIESVSSRITSKKYLDSFVSYFFYSQIYVTQF